METASKGDSTEIQYFFKKFYFFFLKLVALFDNHISWVTTVQKAPNFYRPYSTWTEVAIAQSL